jgi:hypothetical protein
MPGAVRATRPAATVNPIFDNVSIVLLRSLWAAMVPLWRSFWSALSIYVAVQRTSNAIAAFVDAENATVKVDN